MDERAMSEYVYCSHGEPLANDSGEIALAREEIVRCRDCAYNRNRWNGQRPTFSDWFFCAYWGGHELTNLDGFCAWAERKEVER